MASATLFRLSGLALLLVAPIGVLGHVILHPPGHQLDHMNSPIWVPAHSLILISFLLILFGLAGLYARQSHRAGELGLVGFVLAVLSLTVSVTTMVFEVFVVPVLAANPSYQLLAMPEGPLLGGALGTLRFLGTTSFVVAFFLLGVATIRASVLPRSSGLSLIAVAALVLVLIVPVPGILIGVGLALTSVALLWPGWALFAGGAAGAPLASTRVGRIEHAQP
jgi:hypothetical protein